MAGGIWGRIRERLGELTGRASPDDSELGEARELRRRSDALLRQVMGPRAAFREGQWEAIEALVLRGERILVVQRTGWGKSLVYFLAARLLRERGAGPALVVSPLISLMRNQIDAAGRIGIRALTIHSENRGDWSAVEEALRRGACDVLLVSPERLGLGGFLTRAQALLQGHLGMLAVDEAHCISDWGHDFRPDYRRLTHVLQRLPTGTPVLATTATANDRVIADIAEQLGPKLRVSRGSLGRESLSLHVLEPADQATRLAWLADQIPRLPGSGIVYCLTVADCRLVSDWLLARGIAAPPYYAGLEEFRAEREKLLLENRVKALVATVALGMGFDKPDLGFVIHYQCPASAVAYYQQVGRAGRGIAEATVALLHGPEDAAIHDRLLSEMFPDPAEMRSVIEALAGRSRRGRGLSEEELLERVNVTPRRLEQILKLLQADGAIRWEEGRYLRSGRVWSPDESRWREVIERRREELTRMAAYAPHAGCRMQFLTRELDDPRPVACGRCDNCAGRRLPGASADAVREAIAFLREESRVIEPRRWWPESGLNGLTGPLPHPTEPGRALCLWGDSAWGQVVADGKYRDGRFSGALVEACVELVRGHWRPEPPPEWVTAVPSLRRPDLVPEFASRLARALGLPYHPVLTLSHATAEQKEMKNSAQQARNVFSALRVLSPCLSGPVLLVDDVVDSRWTLTLAGHRLREAGSGPVLPLALAEAAGRGGLT